MCHFIISFIWHFPACKQSLDEGKVRDIWTSDCFGNSLTLAQYYTELCDCLALTQAKMNSQLQFDISFGCAKFCSRTLDRCNTKQQSHQIPVSSKMARAWSDVSLLNLANPSDWILSNSNLVVVADKYPKAKYHYLVIPRQKISSIFEVSNFFPINTL